MPAVLPDEQSLGRQSLLEAVRGSRDLVSEVHGFAGIIGTAAQTGPHARQVREEEAVARGDRTFAEAFSAWEKK